STLPVSLRFQSVTPILNLYVFAVAVRAPPASASTERRVIFIADSVLRRVERNKLDDRRCSCSNGSYSPSRRSYPIESSSACPGGRDRLRGPGLWCAPGPDRRSRVQYFPHRIPGSIHGSFLRGTDRLSHQPANRQLRRERRRLRIGASLH